MVEVEEHERQPLLDGFTRPEWSRPRSQATGAKWETRGGPIVALASGDFQIRSGWGKSQQKETRQPPLERDRICLPAHLPFLPTPPRRRGRPETEQPHREGEEQRNREIKMSSAFSGDETAPFFGFLGAAAALIFSCAFPVPIPPFPIRAIKRFPTESCGFSLGKLRFFAIRCPIYRRGAMARLDLAELWPPILGAPALDPLDSARSGAGFKKAMGFLGEAVAIAAAAADAVVAGLLDPAQAWVRRTGRRRAASAWRPWV